VPVDDRGVEVLEQLDPIRTAARIGGQLEEVERVGNRKGSREIGQEDGARLQRRDEQRLAPCVRFGELCAELGDAATDLRTGQVDVPDGVSVCRQGGS
jgi:hypothetical protein